MKAFYFFALLLCFSAGYSQTISGYVYDETENKPLEGAFVYLDGTTFSVSTDARGFFSITTPQKFNAALVVSFMGFETLRVDDPYKYGKPFKMLLRDDAITLKEVVITKGGPFSRKDMLRVFRTQFLGASRAGASCKIENEDDVTLYYDTDANTLHARAYRPIVIINKRLEYKISFDLADFEVNYNTKTLNTLNITRSFFAGTTFYTDISKNDSADKKRKETYLGSTVHLMKTIAAKDWRAQKFQLYVDKFNVDPDDYLLVTDTLNSKKVTLINVPENKDAPLAVLKKKNEREPSKFSHVKYAILYDKTQQTGITFDKGYFFIDHNGLSSPISELTFSGYMGSLRAGDLLPNDYIYKP